MSETIASIISGIRQGDRRGTHSVVRASAEDRYSTLDAMRGIAAVLVAVYHLGQTVGYSVPEGYLAVDLFFALSGFVIALNYTNRLERGWSWRAFMATRGIRLYPLYGLGTCLGIIRRVAQLARVGTHEFTPTGTLIAAMFGLVMLPTPPGIGHATALLFPVNEPAWSLFLEMAVNLLFAMLLFRLSPRGLGGICLAAALYLVARVGAPFWLNVGWAWPNLDQGVARTLYSFPLGIVLWRWKPVLRGQDSWIALGLVALAAWLLCSQVPDRYRSSFDLVAALGVFPLLLFFGIRFELPRLAKPLFCFLGDISYAVYAVHGPLIVPFVVISQKLHLASSAITPVFVGLLLTISFVAHRFFDMPVRRRLSRWRDAAGRVNAKP